MRWIKYQIVQSTIGEEDILINKKVGYSDENLAIAEAEAYDGYEIIEDTESFDKEPLAIGFGGTGATSGAAACENIGAVKKSGDAMTGTLYVPYIRIHNSNNWIGTDLFDEGGNYRAGFTCDQNNRVFFRQKNADLADGEYFCFPIPTTSGVWYDVLTSKTPVTVAQGGTGATTQKEALKNVSGVSGSPYKGSVVYPNLEKVGIVTAACTTEEFVTAMDAYSDISFMHTTGNTIYLTDVPEPYGYLKFSKGTNNNYICGWFHSIEGKVYAYKYHTNSGINNRWRQIYTAEEVDAKIEAAVAAAVANLG